MIKKEREILEFMMLVLRTTTTTTMMMILVMMLMIMMMMMVDLRVDGGRADRTKVGRGEGSRSRNTKFISEFLSSLSTAVDHCFSNPCANNGTCNNSLHGYRCSCPEGFTGSLCEEGNVTICLFVFTKMIEKKREILELLIIMLMLRTTTTMMMILMMMLMMIIIMMMMMVDLRVDGERADRTKVGKGEGIQSRNSKFISVFLSSLSTAVDHCFSNPCANNGTCNNSLHGYRCSCPEGFTGSLCEEGKTTVCLFLLK